MSRSSLGPPSASLPGRVQQPSTQPPPRPGRSPLSGRDLASCDADWPSGEGEEVPPPGIWRRESKGKKDRACGRQELPAGRGGWPEAGASPLGLDQWVAGETRLDIKRRALRVHPIAKWIRWVSSLPRSSARKRARRPPPPPPPPPTPSEAVSTSVVKISLYQNLLKPTTGLSEAEIWCVITQTI